MIRQFESAAELRNLALERNALRRHAAGVGNSWYGGETQAETLSRAITGDLSLVSAAETLLGQLDAQIETPRRTWERSPVGHFCVVPDVLAGLPTPMRRQVESGDEHAPITILAISTSSGGIDARTLIKRGTVILALVIALARIRPVSLQSVCILNGTDGEYVLSTRIETAPLDLANAAWMLTSQGFARRLNYSLCHALDSGCTGAWPKAFRYGDYERAGGYYDHLAQALSPDPENTLVIGAAQLHDELVREPLVWITKQIDRFTQREESE